MNGWQGYDGGFSKAAPPSVKNVGVVFKFKTIGPSHHVSLTSTPGDHPRALKATWPWLLPFRNGACLLVRRPQRPGSPKQPWGQDTGRESAALTSGSPAGAAGHSGWRGSAWCSSASQPHCTLPSWCHGCGPGGNGGVCCCAGGGFGLGWRSKVQITREQAQGSQGPQ